ncbi:hypothetical protein AB0O70_13070 [Microbacterium paraoxydans]|jgi:hypothetical protein|uniref:hypothetical protein n=1 Tax=Microbacterium paraoxydans TaxID=199592 RepID=UPI0034447017
MSTVDIPTTLLVDAPEDSGAQTLDRYAWQASMAVVDLFALAIMEWGRDATAKFAIVCEHQEDYVVLASTGTTLVSVKHRERTRGGWTLASLMTDGGLPHLFDRWRHLDVAFACRLVTCSGMAAAGSKFADLMSTIRNGKELSSDHHETLVVFAKKLAANCDAGEQKLQEWLESGTEPTKEFLELCQKFLGALRLEVDRSDRAELPYAAIVKYVTPFVEFLDIAGTHAPSIWERCNERVLTRMRARGPLEHGGIQHVVNLYRSEDAVVALESTLQSRIFTSEDLREVVDLCVTLGLEPTTVDDLPAPTVLSMKVINGGLTMTTAHWAEQLAQSWRLFEEAAEAGGPGAYAQMSSLRVWVQGRASEASEEATLAGLVDGRIMWTRLRHHLKNVPDEIASPLITEEILLGGACVLASECKVWFSSAFVIEEAMSMFPKRLDGTAA